MKNLIVVYKTDTSEINCLIRGLMDVFNDDRYRNILMHEYGINVTTPIDIEKKLNVNFKQFFDILKNSEEYNNSILFGIHPFGIYTNNEIKMDLRIEKNIKSVGWICDPHWLANDAKNRTEIIQKHAECYDSPILDNLEYLITPSSVYFKNLKMEKYEKKIIDFFYFLDPKNYAEIKNIKYAERLNKIILSGALSTGYKSRVEFNALKEKSKQFDNLIFRLNHPGNKNNAHMTGMNYYNTLSKYKAAFVGHYNFPIDYCLAKHIEVLMCGCLGFYEPNPLLESQLGLKAYEHYIPCCVNKIPIQDINFYTKWMNSQEGEKIAKQGQQYVIENFGEKRIHKFFELIKNL